MVAEAEEPALSKRQQRKLAYESRMGTESRSEDGEGGGQQADRPKAEKKTADPDKAAAKAEEAARKKEEGMKLKAQKKAEAEAARKAKAAEIAEQRKKEAEERKAADAAAAKLAYELGIGTYGLKGDRGYMEDRVLATRLRNGDLFMGVYDGHCGEGCPEYCKQQLHVVMEGMPEFAAGDTGSALTSARRARPAQGGHRPNAQTRPPLSPQNR